eukprot:m.192937 g.192937  ORF g.192937 m.192937 type:complete len:116 (+) comp14870_c0_seq1:938-1285(+)
MSLHTSVAAHVLALSVRAGGNTVGAYARVRVDVALEPEVCLSVEVCADACAETRVCAAVVGSVDVPWCCQRSLKVVQHKVKTVQNACDNVCEVVCLLVCCASCLNSDYESLTQQF